MMISEKAQVIVASSECVHVSREGSQEQPGNFLLWSGGQGGEGGGGGVVKWGARDVIVFTSSFLEPPFIPDMI